MGDAPGQGINIAVGPVQAPHVTVDPVCRDPAIIDCQKAEDPVQGTMMGFRHGFGKIGNAANIPQQANHGWAAHCVPNGAIAHQGVQSQTVVRFQHQA